MRKKRSGLRAIGVDLGATKLAVAEVNGEGRVLQRVQEPTRPESGPGNVKQTLLTAIRSLLKTEDPPLVGIGIGIAGQIDPDGGMVRFAPNLGWENVPLQTELNEALRLPVIVTNDVRAATVGEWLFGAGRGCRDLVCLFVGTGIGGGVVTQRRLLTGSSNTAAELGHLVVDLQGPLCTCGGHGCMEAFAGGWAIARHAQETVSNDPSAGQALLDRAKNRLENITAKLVTEAAQAGDLLACRLMERVTKALIAGTISLVHAFNPARFIFGGGVIEGMPELVARIEEGVRKQAFRTATERLRIVHSQLGGDAGVVGAAALAIRSFAGKEGN